MHFLNENDLIIALEKITYTSNDIKTIRTIFPLILTKYSWKKFTIRHYSHTLDRFILVCSLSTSYMVRRKMFSENDQFGALVKIDRKIGLYNESETVKHILQNFCFDIWDNSGIIQVFVYYLSHDTYKKYI